MPFAAGSATDLTARGLGAKLREILKQSIIVDDKPGASGQRGAAAVATAPPDGYTLLMGTNSINVALFKKLSYDPEKNFAPIIRCVTGKAMTQGRMEISPLGLGEFTAYVKTETEWWIKAIKAAGIEAE